MYLFLVKCTEVSRQLDAGRKFKQSGTVKTDKSTQFLTNYSFRRGRAEALLQNILRNRDRSEGKEEAEATSASSIPVISRELNCQPMAEHF